MYMTFGERLKELREDNDEKQKDIADIRETMQICKNEYGKTISIVLM